MPGTDLDIPALVDNIGTQLSTGSEAVSKIENLSYYPGSDSGFYKEERDFAHLEFESQIEILDISIRMALEALGLLQLLEQYAKDFSKFDGKLTNLTMIPYIGVLASEPLGFLWRYHSTLSLLLGQDISKKVDEEKRVWFERILSNTPKIVKDREVEPQKEADVRQCVYDVLIHMFPDTVREVSVAQVTKTYKPDIGVPSLKAAAEYKFADTEEQVKNAVGGLYEDMRGYTGSEDWKYFYAVIYMTDAFFTREQLLAEFEHTAADDNWKLILVLGRGDRKYRWRKKAKKSAGKKKAVKRKGKRK